ncbi:MAG: Flp family type IVb pilin [Bacillota bacterium]
MLALVNYLKCRFASKKGQGLVEYGMIIGLIAVIIVAAFLAFRQPLLDFFGRIGAFFNAQTL